MSRVVTAEEVVQHFVRSREFRHRLDWWMDDPHRTAVVTAVMAHKSRVVTTATLDDMNQVCRTTKHALGQLKKSETKKVTYIQDWTTAFAGAHVFHFITEHDGAVPTWQRFRKQCAAEPFRHMLWEPAQQAIDSCIKETGISKERARDAMQWRIGNMSYSFLREQWAHAYLRHRGVEILQHPLADALFGVDGWVDNTVISFFIGNRTFRSASGGRKNPAATYLGAAQPAFSYINIELPAARKFGVVMLPTAEQLDRYVKRI
ncbi:hypothetical protein [Actinoplanes sp. TFC3]|uniref:hypothetical protein n=1 Tax=Actinoplanes sp. TFC3 TaxID=1710355 RepID=UPI00083738E9|nr:hypothetical protein [Actinoplanes sp. TFC3]